MVRLIFLHSGLSGAIPGAGGVALHVVFANEGGLNLASSRPIDCLLAALLRRFLVAGILASLVCGDPIRGGVSGGGMFFCCGSGAVRLLRGAGGIGLGKSKAVHGEAEDG